MTTGAFPHWKSTGNELERVIADLPRGGNVVGETAVSERVPPFFTFLKRP